MWEKTCTSIVNCVISQGNVVRIIFDSGRETFGLKLNVFLHVSLIS